MYEVIATNAEGHLWGRFPLLANRPLTVGRAPECDISIPHDPYVSRKQATLQLQSDHLVVSRLTEATNPVFFQGKEIDVCRVEIGQSVVVGSTILQVVALHENDAVQGFTPSAAEPAVSQVNFSSQALKKVRYPDAENRIEVLTHLPEVIAGARTEAELFVRLCKLLLRGIVNAEAAGIVELTRDDTVRLLHWDRRRETAGEFRPSRRLVQEALASNQPHSVLQVWDPQQTTQLDHTFTVDFDWASCTPVEGLSLQKTGFYLAGQRNLPVNETAFDLDRTHLDADVKFTELVSQIIGAVLKSRRWERQRSGLRQFFAPPILAALGDDLDTALLEPCECDVTVMFCDLRGFSQKAEGASDDLLGLLDRVSRALGVMTQQILSHGGVTGDFQGDATLGFWGWPFPSTDLAVNACRAALAIRCEFDSKRGRKDHPLSDFAMGIGLAHGRAVAGKIGTLEQVKVTVFGPVVNLASRLEGLTKQLRVPILLDDATAQLIRQRLPPEIGRLRKLARVLPYGMDRPVDVHELLPGEKDYPLLSDSQIQTYELGVEKFIEGDWEEAYRCLHSMPSSDRAQDFLIHQIAMNNRQPPKDWDGTIRFPGK
ncbi:adenylate/guanylate cyclase domain-containing protein [Planctopirus hydrillae]|uniref:Adenylate cyclase n=1 Tax=Planctopirus hydrillae TaxID=1841610 RepID=A0A1C3E3Y6_9PLAN|nr:adenylate/guanylate cyclase domain-containing protein [Planctopirus hydrillae]ODA27940.1 adenylate cyclase [Planctopirus hydrillae]